MAFLALLLCCRLLVPLRSATGPAIDVRCQLLGDSDATPLTPLTAIAPLAPIPAISVVVAGGSVTQCIDGTTKTNQPRHDHADPWWLTRLVLHKIIVHGVDRPQNLGP